MAPTDPVRSRTPHSPVELPTTARPALPRPPTSTIDPSPDRVEVRSPRSAGGMPPHNSGTRLPPPRSTTPPVAPAEDWSDAAVSRALVRELVTSGFAPELAERALRLKARETSVPDFEALKARPASRVAVRLLEGKLERIAADAGSVPSNVRVAQIARGLAQKLPATMTAWGAKVTWDVALRLEHVGAELGHGRVRPPSFNAITPSPETFREGVVWFNPGQSPADSPKVDGYRIYFATEPPASESGPWGTEANLPKSIDLGNLQPDATNTCSSAFAIDWPDAVDTYYVWLTAYNTSDSPLESGKSNVIHLTFKAAVRGDINHDGVIDVLDVDRLMRILLGEDPAVATSDVNADGVIDQRDLDALVAKLG